MKRAQSDKKFFIASCAFHAGIVLALIFSYEFASPLVVVENTNQHDVISAVVLGDTAKSKILPYEEPAAQPKPEVSKPQPDVKKPPVLPKAAPIKTVDKEAIALKAAKVAEKKLAAKKAQELKNKQKEALEKALLADIKKQNKKIKKQDLPNKFAKMLREQSELSLRQSLMNENIKMRGKEAHYSQGVVNKYQALITQAIQENWNVPPLVNRSLSSVLMIRLSPDGKVLDVQISKSSGDASLDSSARTAVLKSSPLPVPEKASDFEVFRQFTLTVSPKNIVQG